MFHKPLSPLLTLAPQLETGGSVFWPPAARLQSATRLWVSWQQFGLGSAPSGGLSATHQRWKTSPCFVTQLSDPFNAVCVGPTFDTHLNASLINVRRDMQKQIKPRVTFAFDFARLPQSVALPPGPQPPVASCQLPVARVPQSLPSRRGCMRRFLLEIMHAQASGNVTGN